MPVQINWLVRDRVVAVTLSGQLSAEEINQTSRTINEHVVSGVSPVHIYLDIRTVHQTSLNLRELNNLIVREHQDRFGWFILITDSPLARFLGATVIQLARLRVHVAATPDHGLAYLNRVDPLLPDLTTLPHA